MSRRSIVSRLYLSSAGCLLAATSANAQSTADQSGTATVAGSGQSAATSTNAPAVASSRPAGGEGGDIIVTARRVEERLQDVPISITVFNQQQLTNRNVTNGQDLATFTPSLSTNSRYGAERTSFAIRGFTQEATTSPSVAVYFADVVAPRSNNSVGSGNGAGPGNYFDLQNLQVLKGPQGTLFGRNTTGGAVLFVPQKPTSRLEGYVEGSYGNYDMKRIQAVVNAPLMDTLRVRLGVDRQTRDGYYRNRSGIGPSRLGDTDYIAVRGSIVADLASNLENYTIISYNKSNTNGSAAHVIGCDQRPSALVITQPAACALYAREQAYNSNYAVESSNQDPRQFLEQWQVINTTTWAQSDTLTVKNIASYAEFRERTNSNIFGDNLVLQPGSPAPGTRLAVIDYYNDPIAFNAAQSTFTEEFQLQGRTADDKLTYQLGGYLELADPIGGINRTRTQILISCGDYTNLNSCTDPVRTAIANTLPAAFRPFVGPVGSVSESNVANVYHNYGTYAQATYKFTDKLAITGGVRYTWDYQKGIAENVTARINPATGQVSRVCSDPTLISRTATGAINVLSNQAGNGSYVCHRSITTKSDKPTWVIDVEYKPTEDILAYAKYARGYRQGGINPSLPQNQTWGPEKVDAYEAGIKSSFRGALNGTFNVAGFYNDLSNQQIQANAIGITGSGFSGGNLILNGKSRIWGIEVETGISPLRGLRFDVGYTYLNTKLKSLPIPSFAGSPYFAAIIPTAQVGGPLALSPKNKVVATASYTLPLAASIGRITLSGTFTHEDKTTSSRGDNLATTLANGTVVPLWQAAGLPYDPSVIPAHNLVSANLTWTSVAGLPIDLSAFVTNLTKKSYQLFVIGALTTAQYEAQVFNEPRMFGGRLRYHFGR